MKLIIRLLKEIRIVFHIYITGLILLAVSVIGNVISPLIIKNIVDNIITPMASGVELDKNALMTNIILYIFIICLSSLIAYFAMRILVHSANKVAESLRNRAFYVMQNLPISYFDDKPAGKISSRIVNDTETLSRNFYSTVVSAVQINVLNVIFIYGVVFYLNFWFGIILLLLIPLFIIWQKIYAKKTTGMMNSYYENQGEINTHVNEVMNGSSIIQLYSQEENIEKTFLKTSKKMLDAELGLTIVDSTISWSLVEFLQRIFLMVILAFSSYIYFGAKGLISIGLILSLIEYTMKLFGTLGMLVRLFPEIGRSLATGKRVYELLDAKPEEDTDKLIFITEGNVEFKNVFFSYKENVPVLKNISLFAKKGENIALVGNTGSGKSSIMNLLFRFYDTQEGEILIDNQNIVEYNRESIREKMGIVLQDPYLFTGTIASNISMGNENITEDIILDSLIKVGAMPMIERLEKGIYTEVVEKGNSFSSGERQLISFARTLASDPKILILDEATSHIDTETEQIIQKAMNVVKEGRTTFIIAHRLSTIQNADEILVLDNGEIIERGTHEELMLLNRKYSNMYKTQQKI